MMILTVWANNDGMVDLRCRIHSRNDAPSIFQNEDRRLAKGLIKLSYSGLKMIFLLI
jgi:hypothetical protein